MAATLIIEFDGWCQIRQPTDPDPPDETRGASGYTFAFGDEPDLDRVIYFHVTGHCTPRSHAPEIGVAVRRAARHDAGNVTEVEALRGARVELLDNPRLENRNWTLTPAGYEPIVPFHLRIAGDGVSLYREAPLDPDHLRRPLWEIDEAVLRAQGANGIEYEPATTGSATGQWDSVQVAQDRLAELQADLAALRQKHDQTPADRIAIAALEGRIAELQIGIANPNDRRIMARYYVERFGFPMQGRARIDGDAGRLGGMPATGKDSPWQISFWIGAWDPDALQAFVQGVLEIPYAS